MKGWRTAVDGLQWLIRQPTAHGYAGENPSPLRNSSGNQIERRDEMSDDEVEDLVQVHRGLKRLTLLVRSGS